MARNPQCAVELKILIQLVITYHIAVKEHVGPVIQMQIKVATRLHQANMRCFVKLDIGNAVLIVAEHVVVIGAAGVEIQHEYILLFPLVGIAQILPRWRRCWAIILRPRNR